MSRLQRAVAKAEREGLLEWTGRETADRPTPSRDGSSPATRISLEREDDPIWRPDPDTATAQTSTEVIGPLSPLFVAATHPTSVAAEQYRLLRTRLEDRDRGRRVQLVLVTSPGAGDGKT